MLARTKHLLSVVTAVLSVGHVSGQCVSVTNVNWNPCRRDTCAEALIFFRLRQEADVSAAGGLAASRSGI